LTDIFIFRTNRSDGRQLNWFVACFLH